MSEPHITAPVYGYKAIMAKLRENRITIWALRVIQFMVIVALLADFIAYNKPYTAVYKGQRYYPVFADYLAALGLYTWDAELVHARWSELELSSAFWPPVRYSPIQIDTDNSKVSPFSDQQVKDWRFRHFLGTQESGRDVLSGLIHGTRISLSIGLVAMGIAAVIGVIIGSMAGFFGDRRLQISRAAFGAILIALPFAFFYGFQVRFYSLRDSLAHSPFIFLLNLLLSFGIAAAVVVIFRLVSRPLERFPVLAKKRYLPVDMIISRILDIISSIPLLLLLMTLLMANRKGSIYFTMVIIGLFSWAGIAQFMRAEMLRVRELDYVQAARGLGYSNLRILFRHALPNSLSTVLIICAFGVASAIALEASLSFLGIGIPIETMTWGKMLTGARFDIRSWWLTAFPGTAIFITITAMNLVGQGLRDALDPKSRRLRG